LHLIKYLYEFVLIHSLRHLVDKLGAGVPHYSGLLLISVGTVDQFEHRSDTGS
jgi:hypothetical protein